MPIFILIMKKTFRNLKWEGKEINANGKYKYLSHLRFADDTVLIRKDIKELMKIIIELVSESRKAGLEIPYEKTKILEGY